jgi:hypothetical protein
MIDNRTTGDGLEAAQWLPEVFSRDPKGLHCPSRCSRTRQSPLCPQHRPWKGTMVLRALCKGRNKWSKRSEARVMRFKVNRPARSRTTRRQDIDDCSYQDHAAAENEDETGEERWKDAVAGLGCNNLEVACPQRHPSFLLLLCCPTPCVLTPYFPTEN